MSICLLNYSYAWLARRSGFAMLPEALRRNGCDAVVVGPRKGLPARALGKLYSMWKGHPARNQASTASEWEFLLRMRLSHSPGHVLFLEEHLQYLDLSAVKQNWIGTIHMPRRWWKASDLELLRQLEKVTVLCDYMVDQFSDIFDPAQMRVLPYGVDAAFFQPAAGVENSKSQNLLFVGACYRNTAMLARLVPEILKRFPDARFDLVVPLHARGDQAISTLLQHPAVKWHHGIPDEELRSLYQRAAALFLPMDDSGANNTVVEALACGLPIVTTDVGGIRSYGGGTVFPLVANNDDRAFLDLTAAYLRDPSYRSTISQSSRKFAEAKLDWPVAAKEYVTAYRSLSYL
jgi:glycosyltransferase involved in cell wall biosynthesis